MAPEIITIIVALIGTGGLSAILSALVSWRKAKDDSAIAQQNAQKDLDSYISNKMRSLNEQYVAEIEKLRESNEQLQKQINDLQESLQEIMKWIVTDNYTNISFLRSKIKEYDPDFEFPYVKPCPNPWKDQDENNREDINIEHNTHNDEN